MEDGDKSSRKGILHYIPEHPEPRCMGKGNGIFLTQSYEIVAMMLVKLSLGVTITVVMSQWNGK